MVSTAGHLHPPFLAIMDEIQAGLRYLFQTQSKYVLLISGTGHAGGGCGGCGPLNWVNWLVWGGRHC